jgi:hypothetical protein
MAKQQTAIAEPKKSDTERANQLFLEQVREIAGVINVEYSGGQALGEQSIRVHVRHDDLETEYAVYDLKTEIYRLYPDASLAVDVWLEGIPTVGPSDVPDAV